MILDYTIITYRAVWLICCPVPLLPLVPDFIFLDKKKNPDFNCNLKFKKIKIKNLKNKKLNSFKGKREKKRRVHGIAFLFGNTFLKTPKPPHSYLLCSFFSIVPLPKSQVTHLHTTFYVIHFWLQLAYFHTMINLLCWITETWFNSWRTVMNILDMVELDWTQVTDSSKFLI